ncbi:predicted protein [Nematostella vectensis]|uniref:Uncharacterized protein n=1 Tax=Nematostella vectensis TaxID=45351 RepID=A7RX72_NEMVE|nr:predicted protein [Nematostella vectensis]|eukprot:XP_001635976.1 predicted protein [Nematostella vectensis]
MIVHLPPWEHQLICYNRYNSTKLKRAQKRKAENNDEFEEIRKSTRSSTTSYTKDTPPSCVICGLDSPTTLHRVESLEVSNKIQESALVLNDQKLNAKLGAGGDAIALEARYHSTCKTLLERKAKYAMREAVPEDERPQRLEGIALGEVVSYIEENRNSGEISTFKLADLGKLYTRYLEQLGVVMSARLNTSRLKQRILNQLPELEQYNNGRDVYLAFRKDVGEVLQKAHKEDKDEEGIHLAKAATIIRNEIIEHKYSFDGSFDENCQRRSVPPSLVSFLKRILHGKSSNDGESRDQAVLVIAQLTRFNTYVRRREGDDIKRERRNKSRESSLPIFVGVAVHAKTQSRDLVETLNKLGISISYERVFSFSTKLGNEVCRRYHEQGAVCPPNLRIGLFTTSAVDNIDHNPSSTTAKDSLHGTGISLFQHPSAVLPGTVQAPIRMNNDSSDKSVVRELPASYTDVPAVDGTSPRMQPTASRVPLKSNEEDYHRSIADEYSWLEHTWAKVDSDSALDGSAQVSWASYHSHQPSSEPLLSAVITALLPLFPDQAKSVAMIKHSMSVIKLFIEKINPGQIPVIAFDQPLYAVAKEVQWKWLSLYGGEKFVIVFGGLHIEMAFLKVLGQWLEDSGWTVALVDADVASSGTADSFLKASSVTRTRRAHQVTACSLYLLLQRGYQRYVADTDDILPFEEWCEQQRSAIPQFQYWYNALQLELILLVFLKSLRLSDFAMYVDAVYRMLPWFVALNHTHEQNNAVVKGDGGAVGLTENAGALRRWMLSGPEMARLINEFERTLMGTESNSEMRNHHEDEVSYQRAFQKDVKSLTNVLEEYGNPFEDSSRDISVLDTKVVAGEEGVIRMRMMEELGKKQWETFISERLVEQIKPLKDPISRNKLAFFETSSKKRKKSKGQQQLSSMKSDCSLFSRLFIACQTRDGNLEEFFEHENQACPPSDKPTRTAPANPDVIIFDGAVLENMIKPSPEDKTFSDYTARRFVPYIEAQLQQTKRIDLVWDEYVESSLKVTTREARGHGVRQRVASGNKLPRNWRCFLRDSQNKQDLFQLLANCVASINSGEKCIVSSFRQGTLSSIPIEEVKRITPCSHEEADTRMFLHVAHALSSGSTRVVLRTVDTDVLVIAVAYFQKLQMLSQASVELWLAFGTGAYLRYIAAHEVAGSFTGNVAAFLTFHAFTGCDTVSCFYGKGKQKALETWHIYPEVTPVFAAMASAPSEMLDEWMSILERYVADTDDILPFEEWCEQQRSAIPQFQYWYTALQLELILLVFLKSLRLLEFAMYVDALPIHVRDMQELEHKTPFVAKAFTQGFFTVNKTNRRFSSIAVDQAHEQNNAVVKGDGGAVGLTENAGALRRWMLSGPEMARLINEFERTLMGTESNSEMRKHHEDEVSYQRAFQKDVKSLTNVLEEYPFEDSSRDLSVLDTKVVAGEEGVIRMRMMEELGKKHTCLLASITYRAFHITTQLTLSPYYPNSLQYLFVCEYEKQRVPQYYPTHPIPHYPNSLCTCLLASMRYSAFHMTTQLTLSPYYHNSLQYLFVGEYKVIFV